MDCISLALRHSTKMSSCLTEDSGDFVQYREYTDRLARGNLASAPVVDVMREPRQVGEMGRVIPTSNEVSVRLGPMIAVGGHIDPTVGRSLYILGELEHCSVEDEESGTKMAVNQRDAFSNNGETGDYWIGRQTFFDGIEVFDDGHRFQCPYGTDCASPLSIRSRSWRLSRICTSEAHST